MIYRCNHCGAVLNSENDVCSVCACRGTSAQKKRERFWDPADNARHLPLSDADPSVEDQPSPDDNREESRKNPRKRSLLYDLGLLGMVALIVLLFLLMCLVNQK